MMKDELAIASFKNSRPAGKEVQPLVDYYLNPYVSFLCIMHSDERKITNGFNQVDHGLW
jgi:hypothetical protein